MHAKHTPAPWRKAWGKVTDSEGKAICMVTYRKNGPCNDSLIAAAPDMLAALQRTEQMLSDWQHTLNARGARVDPLLDEARAVIARATGEA